jgi:hypothetical protein
VELVERDQEVHTLGEKPEEIEKNAPWGLARISHRDSLSFGTFNKYLYADGAGEEALHGWGAVGARLLQTGMLVMMEMRWVGGGGDEEGRERRERKKKSEGARADGETHDTSELLGKVSCAELRYQAPCDDEDQAS